MKFRGGLPEHISVQRFVLDNTPFALAVDASGQSIITGEDQEDAQIWRVFSLDGLIEWVRAHCYLRELTCLEEEYYQIATDCVSEGT